MRKIMVGKSSFTSVDDNIFNTISKTGWWINSYGYAVRQIRSGKKRINTYLHHLVLEKKHGFDIDHIDRNKLNNQLSNLRYLKREQNNYNSGIHKNNTSGFKGISFVKSRNKWRAYIGGSKNRIELGQFKNKEDAINARLEAEKNIIL